MALTIIHTSIVKDRKKRRDFIARLKAVGCIEGRDFILYYEQASDYYAGVLTFQFKERGVSLTSLKGVMEWNKVPKGKR